MYSFNYIFSCLLLLQFLNFRNALESDDRSIIQISYPSENDYLYTDYPSYKGQTYYIGPQPYYEYKTLNIPYPSYDYQPKSKYRIKELPVYQPKSHYPNYEVPSPPQCSISTYQTSAYPSPRQYPIYHLSSQYQMPYPTPAYQAPTYSSQPQYPIYQTSSYSYKYQMPYSTPRY